jgi:phosphoethanolamine N-methyltransferase
MSGDGDHTVVYGDDFIAKLELLWGDGFLSPGGADEIAELFRDEDLSGASVLNLGCGLGTMDRILARDHGAERVLGVDIETQLIERAQAAAKRDGLEDRVTFQLVAPGPLPFPDGSFDVVTSKDAIICIKDKRAVYGELLRVLKPGGRLIVSDWFGGTPPFSAEMRAWMDSAPGHYFMVTLADTAAMLEDLGFVDVRSRDRNDWYVTMVRREEAEMRGAKRAQLIELFCEAEAQAWAERVAKKAAAVAMGDLRPGHLWARKAG